MLGLVQVNGLEGDFFPGPALPGLSDGIPFGGPFDGAAKGTGFFDGNGFAGEEGVNGIAGVVSGDFIGFIRIIDAADEA